uniref:Type I polyketide synthase n=1 Tax=Gambierdiscus excentricus TaxID=986170 RepID=A0A1S6K847_9DINO|nr:type I polyketide synthase [Gambierdiscus excentricus]
MAQDVSRKLHPSRALRGSGSWRRASLTTPWSMASMPAAWSRSLTSLHLATRIVHRAGQLLGYSAEEDKFSVQMVVDGTVLTLDPMYVHKAPEERLAKPGEGGDEFSFDVLLGPRTQKHSVGEEAGACLSEKGFCVMKLLQSADQLESAFDCMKGLEASGKFGRLPQEIEEGHLGKSGRAKTMWLSPDEEEEGSILDSLDNKMTGLAQVIMPFTEDVLGSPLQDRTPALVCVSMSDADEAEYDVPNASDKELTDYYETWYRSQLRLVYFLGPVKGTVVLSAKESSSFEGPKSEYSIVAGPGTLLLVREDALEYSFQEPQEGETSWMQCFLMSPGLALNIEGEITGDFSVLATKGEGPPPPTSETVSVVAMAIQCAANMYDHHKEWASYMGGTDGQLEVPFMRFDYHPYYSDEVDMPINTTFVKHCAVQEGIDMFDNRIFEISNMDAEAMCPQCRQVLEVGCLILHQRGITKKMCNTHPIHASVSVGCDKEEWLNMPGVPRSVATNNQLAITANRFNYIFNLKGGSYVCDTACSSSLVATHLGKVNLLERRWDPLEWHMAQGTNLSLTVGLLIGGCASHMLSPGGRCFTFNATANGYNRGDGTAGFMLKAGNQDDERWAFLRGTQMGQDGRSASLSAPNGPAQEKCIWGAVREARMVPPESTVWECHGTGTSLGDPIEVGAVRKVQIKMPRKEPLMVSTSKSNIGHLEGSAAAVAMCKCVMTVIKTKCAPTIHFKTLNPHLDHAMFDAIFCTEANPYLYRCGHCQVSSFGVGGTNGHAIFWGEETREAPNYQMLFYKKMKECPAQIIADGTNPKNWEYSGPGFDWKDESKYTVKIEKDLTSDAFVVKWEKQEEGEIEVPEFYSITGTHNEWQDDRMMEGDVPGLYYVVVEVPDSGSLDFRIMAEGDQERSIGPDIEACTKKTAQIRGPEKDLTTFWRAAGPKNSLLRVELYAPAKGKRFLTWLREKDEDGEWGATLRGTAAAEGEAEVE